MAIRRLRASLGCALLLDAGQAVVLRSSGADSPEVDEEASNIVDPKDVGDAFANTRWHAQVLQQWEETGTMPKGWNAVSGPGSTWEVARPFGEWLPGFLKEKGIQTIVECSSGHWPSGWQRNVSWPAIEYTGVDVQPEVVAANQRLVDQPEVNNFGLRSAHFVQKDMMKDPLPNADILLVRDTLVHFPNDAVWKFLKANVHVCPPRFKYVMFDHPTRCQHQYDQHACIKNGNLLNMPVCDDVHEWAVHCAHVNVSQDEVYGGERNIDMAEPPFSLPVETVFEYARWDKHKVQLLTLEPC